MDWLIYLKFKDRLTNKIPRQVGCLGICSLEIILSICGEDFELDRASLNHYTQDLIRKDANLFVMCLFLYPRIISVVMHYMLSVVMHYMYN